MPATRDEGVQVLISVEQLEELHGKLIQDGVSHNDPDPSCARKQFEILHADPFASQYSLRVVDILEGNDDTCPQTSFS